MAAGFTSAHPVLGLSQGSVGSGFISPLIPLAISSSGAATEGGAVSFMYWWMGGLSGYAASSTSPWYFLKSNRKRRSD